MEKVHWYAGVCPSHPEVRREKLKEIEGTISDFEIDGIWLDFVRYPCHWEEVRKADITEYCFCSNCLEEFSKARETPPRLRGPDGTLRRNLGGGEKKKTEAWIQWKCDQITDFVAEVRSLINQRGKKH